MGCSAALVAETVCGGCAIELMNFLIIIALNAWNPKIPPNTTATAISMITMRLVIAEAPLAARVPGTVSGAAT